MRKKIILGICLLLLSGCEIINNKEIDAVLPSVFKTKKMPANQIFEGYKYYLPKGMTLLTKNDYNMSMRDGKGTYYYLYVDVISYYHQAKMTYEKTKDAYYSQALSYHNQKGYLEVTKIGENGYYFVEEMFHYSKMEAYVKEEELQEAVVSMSSILNSICYNDKVLETLVGENILHYKEETFSILKPKGQEESNYDTYLQVDQFIDTEHELPEEDQIEIEEETK